MISLIKTFQKKKILAGFTLIEIIIVVIALGAIAGLALNNYNNIVEQSYCRNAQMNLMTIYNASLVREIKDKSVVDWTYGLDAINPILKINLSDPNFRYTYRWDPNMTWAAEAQRQNSPNSYVCHIMPLSSSNRNEFRIMCSNAAFCPAVIN